MKNLLTILVLSLLSIACAEQKENPNVRGNDTFSFTYRERAADKVIGKLQWHRYVEGSQNRLSMVTANGAETILPTSTNGVKEVVLTETTTFKLWGQNFLDGKPSEAPYMVGEITIEVPKPQPKVVQVAAAIPQVAPSATPQRARKPTAKVARRGARTVQLAGAQCAAPFPR